MQTITIGRVAIGPDQPLAIISGPCLAESYDLCVRIGEAVRDRCTELGFGYIFKASFDKANRSSIGSFRGPGVDEGLGLLERVKKTLGVPITTDIHESDQAGPVGEVIDLLQIPAFLCRQTDLLLAAAQTGRAVNVKKGQFLSPQEMGNAVSKLTEGYQSAKPQAAPRIMLTERGTFFGYHRLVNDFMGVADMMEFGWPVCFDVTHSTQKPGESKTSGGRPERAPMLARCAVAAGVQALFLETHPEPSQGKSDAATMLPIDVTLKLLSDIAALRATMDEIEGRRIRA
jgi:2-dehydro-3-deoxyphosphooctonate aldolase (KDO 8-P synthase)